jgi:hypothetical protein
MVLVLVSYEKHIGVERQKLLANGNSAALFFVLFTERVGKIRVNHYREICGL